MKRTIYLLVVGLIGLVFCMAESRGFTNHFISGAVQDNLADGLPYSLDDTLEPDLIPDFVSGAAQDNLADDVPLRVDAPVKPINRLIDRSDARNNIASKNPNNFAQQNNISNPNQQNPQFDLSKNVSQHASNVIDLSLKLEPPSRIFVDESLPEFKSDYVLVQYTEEKSGNKAKSTKRNAKTNNTAHNHTHKHDSIEVREDDIDSAVKVADAGATATNIRSGKPSASLPDSMLQSIQAALKANSNRAITTVNNTPADVILTALPYGADAKIWQPDTKAQPKNSRNKNTPTGNYIYSIGTLCWNYACSGKTLLRSDGKNVYARVGAGYQSRPGTFLALLAMSNIMPNYELKVGGGIYNIGHLIVSEKSGVSKGSNMSMVLVGLSFYGTPTESWKNDLGETWSIERMVIEELNRPIDQGTSDVTDWLLGLTAAVNLYEEENVPLRGAVALAKKQIGVYQEWVLSVQNENYLWHPKFFLYRGVGADNFETLYASGHILRWLVLSLSDERLQDTRVKRSINNLIAAINRVPTNLPAGSLSDRQLEGLAVSLQTISIYKQRIYGIDE
ncbi:MAG: hypothetical protein LBQ66_10100 [Planctomycetaceae bacterium]|jgi:hypothetical protein|nr:hypothetical protein [Planctomycetaceae bacterium]